MHQYFARPFQLPWLSCLVLALMLLIAAVIRGGRTDADSPSDATAINATASKIIVVHARTNR